MSSRPKLKPSQLTVLIGLGVAAITAGSGIVAAIAQEHDESPVSRAVFANIPSALRGVFYTVLTVMFVAGGWVFSPRVEKWGGGPAGGPPPPPKDTQRGRGDPPPRPY